jgi:hypothetical protein
VRAGNGLKVGVVMGCMVVSFGVAGSGSGSCGGGGGEGE